MSLKNYLNITSCKKNCFGTILSNEKLIWVQVYHNMQFELLLCSNGSYFIFFHCYFFPSTFALKFLISSYVLNKLTEDGQLIHGQPGEEYSPTGKEKMLCYVP